MDYSKIEHINIEVVENGWLVEIDRDDERTVKHVFQKQEDMVRFVDGITGVISSGVFEHVV